MIKGLWETDGKSANGARGGVYQLCIQTGDSNGLTAIGIHVTHMSTAYPRLCWYSIDSNGEDCARTSERLMPMKVRIKMTMCHTTAAIVEYRSVRIVSITSI